MLPTMPADEPVYVLASISRSFGSKAAAQKEILTRKIASQRRFRAKELFCLHDTLNFMRAYPDNPQVLRRTTELAQSLRLDAMTRQSCG